MSENTQNEGIHRQKIFCVLTVARQIEGEWYCFRSEKAFTDSAKADEHAKQLNNKFVQMDGKRMAVKISTEYGDIACSCLASVYEMDLEGEMPLPTIIDTGPNFPHMEHPNIRY